MKNEYIPKLSKIKEVIKHTDLEYTFRMEYDGEVKPGQFFELSIPKYGEAPISVSGIGDGLVDFTIRRVGTVTNEVFENYVGDKLFIRGPYGNGFELENYKQIASEKSFDFKALRGRLSTCRPCWGQRREREQGARAYQPPETRWSAP